MRNIVMFLCLLFLFFLIQSEAELIVRWSALDYYEYILRLDCHWRRCAPKPCTAYYKDISIGARCAVVSGLICVRFEPYNHRGSRKWLYDAYAKESRQLRVW